MGEIAGGNTPPPRVRRWWWALSSIAATVCVVLFARTFDYGAIVGALRRADLGWVAVSLFAFFLVLPLLGEQWQRLLPAGTRIAGAVMWECVTLSMAAMNVLPFGGGHALAAGLLARRAGVGLEGGVSLMALEQLCEAITKAAILVLTLVAMPLPPAWKTGAWSLAGALVGGSIVLYFLARQPGDRSAASSWRRRWSHHLQALRNPRAFGAALLMSFAMKLVQLVGIWAVQRSLGVMLPLSTLPLILTVFSVATMVSISPGNLGVYEAAVFAAYRWLGVPAEQALALAIIQHACFLIPMVGTGYALTLWRTLRGAR